MTPGRIAGLLAVLALCLFALAGLAGNVIARAERNAFRHATSAQAAMLAAELAVDPAPTRERALAEGVAERWDAEVCATGGPSPVLAVPATGDCTWAVSGSRPELSAAGGLPEVEGQLVVSVVVGDRSVALRVPTTPVRARIVEAWTYLYAAQVAVLALVGTVLVRLAGRRQDELVAGVTRQLEALAAGDLSARLGSPSSREDEALALAANSVADRLQVTVERQRTFLADTAHQLRNPLLALQLRVENLEPEVKVGGRRSHARLVSDVKQLGESLSQLVILARTDEGGPDPVALDVLATVDERLHAWIPIAVARRVTIRQRLPEAAVALARPGALEQTLDVLIDNALKYAPPGSEVTVVVLPSATTVDVCIEDRGPGLPPAARAVAAGRGWQATDAASGAGLGLAIASMLISSSGGSLRLEDREDGGGLRASVRLPTPAPTFDDCLLPAWSRGPSGSTGQSAD